MTGEEFFKLAERAVFLSERTGKEFLFRPISKEREGFFEKWKEVFSDEEPEFFEKRLRADNLDGERIKDIFGEISFSSLKEVPFGIDILEKIISKASEIPFDEIYKEDYYNRFFLKKAPLPFEEFFLPFILAAEEELLKIRDENYSYGEEKVFITFGRYLLEILNFLSASSVYEEFLTYKNSFSREKVEENNNSIYNSFMKKMLSLSLKDFFLSYPLLSRFIATYINNWMESTGEFFFRLKKDFSHIGKVFAAGGSPGKVITVIPGLSDHHNGGRTVIFLAFSSGLKLIYKPRSLSMEGACFNFFSYLNKNGSPFDFKILKILEREDYGWMEFGEPFPCKSEDEIEAYYKRAGMMVCLFYLLGAWDLHFENIIASGEFPLFIDLETVMMPRPVFSPHKREWNSVMRTGILPYKEDGNDLSSFAGQGEKDITFSRKVWKNHGTDNIKFDFVTEKVVINGNLPVFAGKAVLPFDYSDAIVEGFREFYNYILINREKLLLAESPLYCFKGKKLRFFIRPTSFYLSFLEKILKPSLLKDALLWSIELEALAKDISIENMDLLLPIFKSEVSGLSSFDIPYFSAFSDSKDLFYGAGKKIDNFFAHTGYNDMMERLKGFSLEDMEMQIELIENSLIVDFYIF